MKRGRLNSYYILRNAYGVNFKFVFNLFHPRKEKTLMS